MLWEEFWPKNRLWEHHMHCSLSASIHALCWTELESSSVFPDNTCKTWREKTWYQKNLFRRSKKSPICSLCRFGNLRTNIPMWIVVTEISHQLNYCICCESQHWIRFSVWFVLSNYSDDVEEESRRKERRKKRTSIGLTLAMSLSAVLSAAASIICILSIINTTTSFDCSLKVTPPRTPVVLSQKNELNWIESFHKMKLTNVVHICNFRRMFCSWFEESTVNNICILFSNLLLEMLIFFGVFSIL